MGTKRTYTRRSFRGAPISDAVRYLLETGDYAKRGDFDTWFDAFALAGNDAELEATWDRVRDEIVTAWIDEHPGTRPAAWWWFDAPEPERRRVGGIGDLHEGTARTLHCGIPTNWVNPWMVEMWNGHARDICGKKIGVWREGDFPHVAPDPEDPPRFESQAAYLERHGLLTAAERRRVPADAFEPEPIQIDQEAERHGHAV